MLEAQAALESHDQAACEQLAESTADPVASLLVAQIEQDGQRHDLLLQSLIGRLEHGPQIAGLSTTLPVPSESQPLVGPDTLASVRSLIRDERENARQLRYVARQEPDLYDGLFGLLLETIARDAEKHAFLLRYLLSRFEKVPQCQRTRTRADEP
jgi:hypothetical protein